MFFSFAGIEMHNANHPIKLIPSYNYRFFWILCTQSWHLYLSVLACLCVMGALTWRGPAGALKFRKHRPTVEL